MTPLSTRKLQGFSLVEVMVALVILSIGLLGLAGLQLFSLKNTGNAYFRTQATLLANEMVERMRSNPLAIEEGAYAVPADLDCATAGPAPCTVQCDSTTETGRGELARQDIYAVFCGPAGDDGAGNPNAAGIDDLLPSGALVVQSTPPGVTVTWVETAQKPLTGDAIGDDPVIKQVTLTFVP